MALGRRLRWRTLARGLRLARQRVAGPAMGELPLLVGTCHRPYAAMVALVTKSQLLRVDLRVRIRAMGRLLMKLARARQANH